MTRFRTLLAVMLLGGAGLAHAQTEATTVQLALPWGVAYDASGNLYVAAANDQVVRKVDLKGLITTVAGTGEQGFGGDGGAATAAVLDTPSAIAIDTAGNIFIADSHNNRVREIAAATGIISTIAGTGVAGFSGDGAVATAATLNDPQGVAVNAAGNVYIADTNNHRIRKITGTTISTVAGNGDQAYEGDGGAATATGLDSPNGIAVDSAGNLYIGDTHNQRVREVAAATGLISTLAGTGVAGFSGDGAGTTASLDRPRGVSVDSTGKIYFADSDNNRIRTITGGTLSTLAGTGEQGFGGDTGPATSAILDTPRSTAVSALGTSAFADTHNERVRTVTNATGIINTVAGMTPNGGLGLELNGLSSNVYNSGQLTATFSNSGKSGSGTVTLMEGSTVLTTGTLSGNAVTLTLPPLAVGTHTLTASFPGDTNNPAVASGVFIVTVTPAQVTATANPTTVAYGAPIPALTGSLTGVAAQDTANVTAVFATTAVQGSPVGVYPITVTLAGSAASNYTVVLSPSSGSLTIGQAGTTTVLTASPNPAFLGAPLTLTATVSSQTTGTPSGTVSFADGGTQIGTGVLNASGVATFTTSALALGSHNLSASTPASTNFLTSSSSTVVEVIAPDPDFTLSATGTTTQTVVPGSSVSFAFNVASTGGAFTNPVTLTASGLPAGATATFSPASVTPGASGAAFTMTVTAPVARASLGRNIGTGTTMAFALLLLPLVGLRRRRILRTFTSLTASMMLIIGLATAAAVLSGCGSENGFFRQEPQTYTITVTATGTNISGAQVQHSTAVTLIVQ